MSFRESEASILKFKQAEDGIVRALREALAHARNSETYEKSKTRAEKRAAKRNKKKEQESRGTVAEKATAIDSPNATTSNDDVPSLVDTPASALPLLPSVKAEHVDNTLMQEFASARHYICGVSTYAESGNIKAVDVWNKDSGAVLEITADGSRPQLYFKTAKGAMEFKIPIFELISQQIKEFKKSKNGVAEMVLERGTSVFAARRTALDELTPSSKWKITRKGQTGLEQNKSAAAPASQSATALVVSPNTTVQSQSDVKSPPVTDDTSPVKSRRSVHEALCALRRSANAKIDKDVWTVLSHDEQFALKCPIEVGSLLFERCTECEADCAKLKQPPPAETYVVKSLCRRHFCFRAHQTDEARQEHRAPSAASASSAAAPDKSYTANSS